MEFIGFNGGFRGILWNFMGFQWYVIPNSTLLVFKSKKLPRDILVYALMLVGVIRKNTGFAKKKWYFDFSLQPTKTMLVFNEVTPNS